MLACLCVSVGVFKVTLRALRLCVRVFVSTCACNLTCVVCNACHLRVSTVHVLACLRACLFVLCRLLLRARWAVQPQHLLNLSLRRLVGIATERGTRVASIACACWRGHHSWVAAAHTQPRVGTDIVRKVAAAGVAAKATLVGSIMTADPHLCVKANARGGCGIV